MANQLCKLRLVGDEKIGRLTVPVESATVIPAGTFVSYESGYGVDLDAQADDATFLGVAEGQTKAGETDDISVFTEGVFQCPVTSAAYTIGQALHFNATSGALEDATANSIAWAWEDTGGTSVSTLKVLVDAPGLAKLFSISA